MSPTNRFCATPGTAQKRSISAMIKQKAIRSASSAASIHVPSDTFGSMRFAIKPTPKCPTNISSLAQLSTSEFRIELEERVQRLHQLPANLVLAAFDQVHRDMRLVAAFERDFRILQLLDVICRK